MKTDKHIILDIFGGHSSAANNIEIAFQGNTILEVHQQLLSRDEIELLNMLFKVLSILQTLHPVFSWLINVNYKVDKLLRSLVNLEKPYFDDTEIPNHYEEARILRSYEDSGLNISISDLFKSISQNVSLWRMLKLSKEAPCKIIVMHGVSCGILFCVFRL